jgi:hypothetical protein
MIINAYHVIVFRVLGGVKFILPVTRNIFHFQILLKLGTSVP